MTSPRTDLFVRAVARRASLACSCASPQTEQRRPSRIIAEQREVIAELEGLIALLKGALAAENLEEPPIYRPWMNTLTPQEQALMGALYRCYPRPLNKHALVDLLPGQDHVEDRGAGLVAVKVCNVRKKLGAGAIEHIRGLGYRLSREQHTAMRQAETSEPATLKLAA